MSKLSEILRELIDDKNFNIKMFAENVGVNASGISHYLNETRTPNIKILIKIANYFNCSTDYLLGREPFNDSLTFKECPPFNEQLKFLLKESGLKDKDVYCSEAITKSGYFEWKNGRRLPSLDNVVKLAEIFDCRVDFLLGRES